uniref:Uncharacterized protein n=1 Tax=Helianthus annuus TaxID=4232 RepID=A0A251RWF7_HELAN
MMSIHEIYPKRPKPKRLGFSLTRRINLQILYHFNPLKKTVQNPTAISPFHHFYIANLVEEHSRACKLCGRYLLQFSTFSDINRSFSCGAFSWINSSQLCRG